MTSWSGRAGSDTELVVMGNFLGILNLLHANADGFNGRGDLVAEGRGWPRLFGVGRRDKHHLVGERGSNCAP